MYSMFRMHLEIRKRGQFLFSCFPNEPNGTLLPNSFVDANKPNRQTAPSGRPDLPAIG